MIPDKSHSLSDSIQIRSNHLNFCIMPLCPVPRKSAINSFTTLLLQLLQMTDIKLMKQETTDQGGATTRKIFQHNSLVTQL
jgi:hypothetical protein